MALTQDQLRVAIEKAKAELAARAAKKQTIVKQEPEPIVEPVAVSAPVSAWTWNSEQMTAISNGVVGKSFVLIGAAGTGKTTTLKGLLQAKLDSNSIPMLKSSTEYLYVNTPGVALVSFTRRAVRNIARQMPAQLKNHCMTIHKLLEYKPEFYEDYNSKGELVNKVRFVPSRNETNPLPRELTTIIVDESSMVDIALFQRLLDALRNPEAVQFIFLGDLNQLPPVYGQAILGAKLLELPVVELTQVYRQALESPIISLALAVKNNNFADFNRDAVEKWSNGRFQRLLDFDTKELSCLIPKDPKAPAMVVLEQPGRGKVTLQVWKRRFDEETALTFMAGQVKAWIDSGYYNPDEDLILCPFNKGFGTEELNRHIADKLAKKRGAEVWEVISGFQTLYLAVGDKVMVEKEEAIILDISKNPKYLGKRPAQPSLELDRWGHNAKHDVLKDAADVDIDALLGSLSSGEVEDKVNQCSHAIKVRMLDRLIDDEVVLTTAGEVNAMIFAYAITVHKAQGSECRKVFFLTHYRHATMLSRELVYTAITRAAEELHIICTPAMLETAARKPRIKGDTLEEKLRYFGEILKERQDEKEE